MASDAPWLLYVARSGTVAGSRRECTDLMYCPFFDSAQAERQQQTSLDKRRR